MDLKAATARIRSAVRKATRTEGDPLHGLTISVRYTTASLMQATDITVRGLSDQDAITRDDDGERTGWTVRARDIAARLFELGAEVADHVDGRHTHFDISFEGHGGFPPACLHMVSAEEDARLEALNDADRAEIERHADDDTTPRCPNGHGRLVRRADPTKEHEFVGDWWDCPGRSDGVPCWSSVVIPSTRFLAWMAELNIAASEKRARQTCTTGARRGNLTALRAGS